MIGRKEEQNADAKLVPGRLMHSAPLCPSSPAVQVFCCPLTIGMVRASKASVGSQVDDTMAVERAWEDFAMNE